MNKPRKDPPPVVIDRPWTFKQRQEITLGKRTYDVNEAIRQAEELEVYEMPVAHITLNYFAPCGDTFRSFVEHMQGVLKADLSYPILLNEDGAIIDGRHRLAKALIDGHATIKYRRFASDPSGCYKTES